MTTCQEESAGVNPGAAAAVDSAWPVPRPTRWISQGLEVLASELPDKEYGCAEREDDFDVVIVGTGYGGAIAASELAGCKTKDDTGAEREISVCVLERGKEYLGGMFPSRMADLAGHVRFNSSASPAPRGEREGLFDFRVGPDLCALVANGIGGGSLINAGVMEAPTRQVFQIRDGDVPRWPEAIRNMSQDEWDPLFERARVLLGAKRQGRDGGLEDSTLIHRAESNDVLQKHAELDKAGERIGVRARPVAVTVASTKLVNSSGVARECCLRCGDCATGCNHDAKNSLDVGLLRKAQRQSNVRIFSGATVLRIERLMRDKGDNAWLLHVVHTDQKLRTRQPILKIAAQRVILAAGTLGSTEILLRSRSQDLRFSSQLGHKFSGNGDLIAGTYDQEHEVNAIADESQDPKSRHVGPTITGMIDLRGRDGLGPVIEELAIPGPLRRAFEEVITTAGALHRVTQPDESTHRAGHQDPDRCAVDPGAIKRSSVLAVMGHDGADGALELIGNADDTAHGDGSILVRWPGLARKAVFSQYMAHLDKCFEGALTEESGCVVPNPIWRPLPARMDFLVDGARGPLLTVHPLGGCAMGDRLTGPDATHAIGVVDDCGRVLDAMKDEALPGLAVLDGSIVPTSLGINPALTIAALALRAMPKLRATWGYSVAHQEAANGQDTRPRFRDVAVRPAQSTQIEIQERIWGEAWLRNSTGTPVPVVVELTLKFKPRRIVDLLWPSPTRGQFAGRGKLRIVERCKYEPRRGVPRSDRRPAVQINEEREKAEDDAALSVAIVEGTLDAFGRAASTPCQRRRRAICAWLRNRGVRETLQYVRDKILGRQIPGEMTAGERFRELLNFSTHAGEMRELRYYLAVCDVCKRGPFHLDAGAEIVGSKTLTYNRRANPWRQLSEMKLLSITGLELLRAPGQVCWRPPVLKLDLPFLARENWPLVRIAAQEDQPAALVDLAAVMLYIVRLLINTHLWSFKKPDAPKLRDPRRLPSAIRRIADPEVTTLDFGSTEGGIPIRALLTRYPRRKYFEPPVLLIHGYSASGTTFAHPALKPGLAEYLWRAGRDVWVLDLRTSCGLPQTASMPWTFEEVARVDIPAAVAHIVRTRLAETRVDMKVDIVAHCMGAAMLSLALLEPLSEGTAFLPDRTQLPARIRKVVLSQVGPSVIMSASNVLRGHIFSTLRYYLPFSEYEFRASPGASIVDQLINRLLSTLPYPDADYDRENPLWPWPSTGFVGTRHRMDALFGRTMNLPNVTGKVLRHIDDFFGRINLETLSQPIQFAAERKVTDAQGRTTSFAGIEERFTFPVLLVVGSDNGLADRRTAEEMQMRWSGAVAPASLTTKVMAGFGHQDSLIGRSARLVFDEIESFLEVPVHATKSGRCKT